MKSLAFTVSYNGYANVLKSKIGITENKSIFEPPASLDLTAIWDTGATKSVITKTVAQKLNLKLAAITTVNTAKGSYETSCYYIDLFLPNKVVIPKLLVMEGEISADILIGMDVIGQGDFAVSSFNAKTSFSFRIPSCSEINFVKHNYILPVQKENFVGRNDPCPCGSGKKYKVT